MGHNLLFNESLSQFVVDTSKDCVYDSTLYVIGSRMRQYNFFISSDIKPFLKTAQNILVEGGIKTVGVYIAGLLCRH